MIPDDIDAMFERIRGPHAWMADAQGHGYLVAQVETREAFIDFVTGHPWLARFDRYSKNIWPRGYTEPDLEFADAVDDGVAEFAERLAELAGTIAICQRELALRRWPN